MAHEVIWTKLIVDTFEQEAILSELEKAVLRTRAAGWTRTQQMFEFGISQSTLDRIIKRLKKKYDVVQKDNPLVLPPRRSSAFETYMDNN